MLDVSGHISFYEVSQREIELLGLAAAPTSRAGAVQTDLDAKRAVVFQILTALASRLETERSRATSCVAERAHTVTAACSRSSPPTRMSGFSPRSSGVSTTPSAAEDSPDAGSSTRITERLSGRTVADAPVIARTGQHASSSDPATLRLFRQAGKTQSAWFRDRRNDHLMAGIRTHDLGFGIGAWRRRL